MTVHYIYGGSHIAAKFDIYMKMSVVSKDPNHLSASFKANKSQKLVASVIENHPKLRDFVFVSSNDVTYLAKAKGPVFAGCEDVLSEEDAASVETAIAERNRELLESIANEQQNMLNAFSAKHSGRFKQVLSADGGLNIIAKMPLSIPPNSAESPYARSKKRIRDNDLSSTIDSDEDSAEDFAEDDEGSDTEEERATQSFHEHHHIRPDTAGSVSI